MAFTYFAIDEALILSKSLSPYHYLPKMISNQIAKQNKISALYKDKQISIHVDNYNFIAMGKGHSQDDISEEYSQDQNQQQKVQIRKPKIQRIDKFKTLKKIVINVSMTQYPVVSQVAQELNWKIQHSNDAGDWDVYWTDFAIDPDILIKMHLFQKINHYPGMHVIARKNLLGINLMALKNKFPEEYNFFPLTWMLPMQYAQFRAYYETKPKGKARTYIAKPEADCQGRGIFLTRKIQDLQNGKHYVVQRYLARPFLLQGLKFDLRIYALLCGTNPLRLYMYNQGLARLATETYLQPNTSNLQKQYIHLTNYAINKNNPKFIFNNNSGNMGIGHKRSITCVFKQLGAMGINVEQLKQKINDVAIKTLICGLPHMSHQYKCSQPEDYAGNMCFHILGLDIMLNNKGQPILLQVNHTPSFTTDTPLDHKIKFNLIRDSLKLMNINSKSKNQLFNRTKEINKERLLSGKRQIFQGVDRQAAVKEAQALRDEYEDKNLGGFTRIFPSKDEQKMKRYNQIIQTANKAYIQQNGSIRLKQIQRQSKKLIKLDYKLAKKQKEQAEKMNQNKSQLKSQHLTIENHQNSFKKIKQNNQNPSFLGQTQKNLIYEFQSLNRSQNALPEKQASHPINKIRQHNRKLNLIKNEISNSNKSQVSQGTEQTTQSQNIRKAMHSQKSSSIRKIDRIQNIQLISRQKQRMKSINVVQNHISKNNGSKQLVKNDGMRPQKMNRGAKIYELSRVDDKKDITSNNFVMPKIININMQNERKNVELPNPFPAFRKGNAFNPNQ